MKYRLFTGGGLLPLCLRQDIRTAEEIRLWAWKNRPHVNSAALETELVAPTGATYESDVSYGIGIAQGHPQVTWCVEEDKG